MPWAVKTLGIRSAPGAGGVHAKPQTVRRPGSHLDHGVIRIDGETLEIALDLYLQARQAVGITIAIFGYNLPERRDDPIRHPFPLSLVVTARLAAYGD